METINVKDIRIECNKTITINYETHRKLSIVKAENGFTTYNETILFLIKKHKEISQL